MANMLRNNFNRKGEVSGYKGSRLFVARRAINFLSENKNKYFCKTDIFYEYLGSPRGRAADEVLNFLLNEKIILRGRYKPKKSGSFYIGYKINPSYLKFKRKNYA